MDYTYEQEIHYAKPGSYEGEMLLPLGTWKYADEFAQLSVITTDNVDWKAPGVREHMMAPPVNLGPYRSAIYDRQRAANQAPYPNYDEFRQNDLMFGDWAKSHGSFVHDMVARNRNHEIPGFVDRGSWSAQSTGFTALKDFKPNSSLLFI